MSANNEYIECEYIMCTTVDRFGNYHQKKQTRKEARSYLLNYGQYVVVERGKVTYSLNFVGSKLNPTSNKEASRNLTGAISGNAHGPGFDIASGASIRRH